MGRIFLLDRSRPVDFFPVLEPASSGLAGNAVEVEHPEPVLLGNARNGTQLPTFRKTRESRSCYRYIRARATKRRMTGGEGFPFPEAADEFED